MDVPYADEDQRINGHDYEADKEVEDCFERALWNTSEPNHGPMNIYHPDSDFFGG